MTQVEIRRVANGYMLIPHHDYRRGDYIDFTQMYFYRDFEFNTMTEKLHELLNGPPDEELK